MMQVIKFSIIIVTWNEEKTINITLKSISEQTYKNYEIIIIDNLSNDKTLEIISKYCLNTMIITEKDRGIYYAMNKGIRYSNSDYLIFLNSGDSFHSQNTLERVKNDIDTKSDIVYGDVEIQYRKSKKIIKAKSIENLPYGMICCHQSMIIKRDFMEKNEYNTKYSLVADYDFTYNAYLKNARFQKLNYVISNYISNGISDIRRVYRDSEVLTVAMNYQNDPRLKVVINHILKIIISWTVRYLRG